jgi:tetratricopeptide (TPR) repeat protein
VTGGQFSGEFASSLRAALTYWQERLASTSDVSLDAERHNIYRAVSMGLALPETQAAAAEVAAAAFPFVFASGYWAEWLRLMERAAANGAAQPPVSRFWVLTRLGQLRRLNQKLRDSLAAHESALEEARTIGEPLLLAEAHYHLGRAQRDAHQYPAAVEHLQEALRLLEQAPAAQSDPLSAAVHNALGRVADDQGQLAEARQHLERAVQISRAGNRIGPLADHLHDLGNLYRASGMHEEALACYEEALALLAGTEHRLEAVQIQYSVGVLHFTRREFGEAEKGFRQIDWAFLRATGNLHLQAMLLTASGNAVLYQERYEEAAATLREGVALWEQLEDELELANAVGSLGEALAAMGAKDEASAMFNRALALVTRYPDHAWARRLRAFFMAEQEKLAAQTAT